MNISFIGAGNLAWHLAPALDNTEYAVKEVFSRNIENASALIEKLYEATPKATLDFSISPSKIFVISANDDAIEEIAREIVLPDNALLVHTSGSMPLSVLAYSGTPNIGVFYPLQTFTKNRRVDFKEIPVFIESENPETEKVLTGMAKAITKKVYRISSADRKALHVAAVFAANFTNHMLTLSKEILAESKLDFEYLKPLIVETISKALSLGPENSQTGPAKRGDFEVLDHHMEFLKDDEEVAEIYKIISQQIVDKYVQD
jgi:predicted short-subunit dehydrogenase-like oxidoreductase (DUF2520 family)